MDRLIEYKKPACITLAIVNIPTMYSEVLLKALSSVVDIEVIPTPGAVEHVGGILRSGSVDVIVVGCVPRSDDPNSVTILRMIKERHANTKVIALTGRSDYSHTIELFRAGANGIICTAELRFDLLCKSVRCVYEGQVWANNELLRHLVLSLSRPKLPVVTGSRGERLLTQREQEVLSLLTDGMSNSELAVELRISEHTVKNHLFRIYDKLGVSNRMEAVLYALTRLEGPAPMLAEKN
jgi:DNA-binding NarL/FixJ family response regulator